MSQIYEGSLNYPKLTGIVRWAYSSYRNQISRCNDKNRRDYKYYGARGIRVEYTAREFVYWVVCLEALFKNLKRPNIGRIDNSKNYSLKNIELIEASENLKEQYKRTLHIGSTMVVGKRVLISERFTGAPVVIAISISDAARYIGMSRGAVSLALSRGNQLECPYRVEYYNGPTT